MSKTPNWVFVWRAQHQGKRRFPTRLHAWKAIVCMWVRYKRVDTLRPYVCTWTNGPHPTKDGIPHIHVGHDRRVWRSRYVWHHFLVWPFYRVRLRVKILFGYSDHQPYKKKKKRKEN